MGDQRGRQGWGEGWVWRGVVGGQDSHKVEAAGVEAGAPPGTHHQDLLSVVVEGGDSGRHADSEGNPGHTEEEEQVMKTGGVHK